jgi:hypothetical protein
VWSSCFPRTAQAQEISFSISFLRLYEQQWPARASASAEARGHMHARAWWAPCEPPLSAAWHHFWVHTTNQPVCEALGCTLVNASDGDQVQLPTRGRPCHGWQEAVERICRRTHRGDGHHKHTSHVSAPHRCKETRRTWVTFLLFFFSFFSLFLIFFWVRWAFFSVPTKDPGRTAFSASHLYVSHCAARTQVLPT